MEVPKVKKLCNELNQMGVKHLIFTLDNVSLKTFGDSDSIKILGEGQEIQHLVEQILKRAKRVETTKEDENGEVFAASNVNFCHYRIQRIQIKLIQMPQTKHRIWLTMIKQEKLLWKKWKK